MRFRSLLALAAVTPVLIAAAEPGRLKPSSPWVLNYAEDSCRLIRTFGEGTTKTVFQLESAAPDEMDMLLVGKPLATGADEVAARFLPVGGKPIKGTVAHTTQSGEPAILWKTISLLPDEVQERLEKEFHEKGFRPGVRPPPSDLAEIASVKAQHLEFAGKITEIEIQTRRNRPVIIETGPLGAPIKLFDQCGQDSLRDWGVDPDLEAKIVRRAWPLAVNRWFYTNDYPEAMIRQGKESVVKIRLLVDASGKVTKCTSLSHFDEPQFNQVVCAGIMKRAKFAPAELADGTKAPSYYINNVVFRLAR
jgi:TonB family protein